MAIGDLTLISRDKYLNDLIVRMGNGMVKVVTGARRCGKTFLLFELFEKPLRAQGVDDDHIIEIALDDLMYARYRDPLSLYDYVKSRIVNRSEPYYVLLDEVQYAISDKELRSDEPPQLYGVLNGLLRMRNVDVYVTGGNSKMLSTDVMTQFRGRGDEIRVSVAGVGEGRAGESVAAPHR
ncbi:ATPase (AAA superfamily)-like protein [Bifidobacterium reuteri DSM 23975]|uniref:ATPase (AAA superfamily)-like protein n=1 Tax=Bifidobacterium reuteri DSM 23975 TaxID=1437610 RepID=A0A087CYE2_9BIFI|nr:ATPase (AAA superfamily)-like protein [Bifidobacterium reuteri DSM 23975]